eukprot:358772-Chlamydomonas_euryale.AAC.6
MHVGKEVWTQSAGSAVGALRHTCGVPWCAEAPAQDIRVLGALPDHDACAVGREEPHSRSLTPGLSHQCGSHIDGGLPGNHALVKCGKHATAHVWCSCTASLRKDYT